MTYIQEAETATWASSATPRSTSSFDVLAGDVIVAVSITDDNDMVITVGNNGAALPWVTEQVTTTAGAGPGARISTAIVPSDRTGLTVSFARSATVAQFGGIAMTFRDVAVGASTKEEGLITDALSFPLTTTQAGSSVVVAVADTALQDQATRVFLAGAGAVTERTIVTTTDYAIYVWVHLAAGAAGTYTLGLTAPDITGAAVALELLNPIPSEVGMPASYTRGRAPA